MRTATWLLVGLMAGGAFAQAPKKYLLSVGIQAYEHEDLRTPAPLKFAAADAVGLAALLGKADYQVVLMTDDAGARDPALKPTKANIEARLKELLGRCRAGDTMVVAFAGHGLQFTGGDAYFCPQDARPFPEFKESLLSIEVVYKQLQGSFAGVRVLLVDACRNDPDRNRGRSGGLDADAAPTPPRGVAVLFSSSAGQKSWENAGLGHGVFFHNVLKGLEGDAADKDGDVAFENLVAYVRKRVPQTMKSLRIPAVQTPNFKGDLAGDPAVLLTVAAADRHKTEPRSEMPAPRPALAETPTPGGDYASRSTGMKFKLIKAGSFLMGAADGEAEAQDDEKPQRRVTITKAFQLGMTEVTQAQYQAVMGANPSSFKGDDLPVETVSWFDAVRFCNALSEKDGKRPCYTIGAGEKPTVTLLADGNGYRLPTEAEWEYACRAGTSGPFGFDGPLTPDKVNYDGNFPYGGAAKGAYREKTVAAGSLPANAFGLHEMHGNVWEWCWDAYDAKYYQESGNTVDPKGTTNVDTAAVRSLRGGCWDSTGRGCRSAYRRGYVPGVRYRNDGFRVVAVPE